MKTFEVGVEVDGGHVVEAASAPTLSHAAAVPRPIDFTLHLFTSWPVARESLRFPTNTCLSTRDEHS